MSAKTSRDEVGSVQTSLSASKSRFAARVFGDRTGLTLFFAALTFLGLCWRQGVPINDNYTILNALVAVADGHLYLERPAFGPGLATPGTVTANGQVYGRNYGEVFLALPVLLGLRALALVADLRLLLAGAWSLCVLGTVVGAGALLNRENKSVVIGSGLALLAFLANVVLATELPARWYPLIALQIVSAVAGALTGVLVYRLLRRVHESRLGIAAGIMTVLAMPVGFWATIPKRHVLIACLAIGAVYLLYRSREQQTETGNATPDLRHRAGAYALTGLAAWIAAPEGVVLGLAVAVADLSTLRRLDLCEMGVISVVTVVAFLPFFLTNIAIAGDPLTAPRYLPGYVPAETATGTSVGGSGSVGGAQSAGSTGDIGIIVAFDRVVGQFIKGATTLVERPTDAWETFVRSGYDLDTWTEDVVEGANLSVLESAPLFAPIAGTAALGARRVFDRFRDAQPNSSDVHSSNCGAVDVADRFALVYAVLLTLAYIPRLPVHAQITVRYLVPMYPLLLYAVARLPAVQRAVEHRWRYAAWTYAGTVLIAGQLFLAGVTVLNMTNGQSMQAHAVVNLTVATLLGLWAIAATLGRRREGPDHYDAVGAILLGLAAGAGTVLILLATIAYFPTGGFFLPLVPSL